MIELLNISFVFFSILIFLIGGIFNFCNNKKTSIISIDNLSQNLISLLSLIWIASIFDLPKEVLFIFLYIISFFTIFCLIFLKKILVLISYHFFQFV